MAVTDQDLGLNGAGFHVFPAHGERAACVAIDKAGGFVSAPSGDQRASLSDVLRDVAEPDLALRCRGRSERNEPGQVGTARAIRERGAAALAHAGDNDPAGTPTPQPADRAVDLGQAIEKRAVICAPSRPTFAIPFVQGGIDARTEHP